MSIDWTATLRTEGLTGPAHRAHTELKGLRDVLGDVDRSSTRSESGLGELGKDLGSLGSKSKGAAENLDDLGENLDDLGDDADHAEAKARNLDRELKRLGTEALTGWAGHGAGLLEALIDDMGDLSSGTEKAGASAQMLGTVALGAVAAGAGIAALGVVELTKELGKLGAEFATEVAGASEVARSTRAMFAAAHGGDLDFGNQAFEDIHRLALRTGADFEFVRETYGTLSQSGVHGPLLGDLVRLRAAFQVMGDEAEAAFGKFTDAMVEGEVTASQFEDISKNVGGRDLFGKALGLSDKALQRTQAGVTQLDKELKKLDPYEFLELSAAFAKANMDLDGMSRGAKTASERLDSLREGFLRELGKDIDFGFGPILDDLEGFLFGKQIEAGSIKINVRSAESQAFVESLKSGFEDLSAAIGTAWELTKAFSAGFASGLGIDQGEDDLAGLKAAIEALTAPKVLSGVKYLGLQVAILGRAFDLFSGLYSLRSGLAVFDDPTVLEGVARVRVAVDALEDLFVGIADWFGIPGLEVSPEVRAALADIDGAINALHGVVDEIRSWFGLPPLDTTSAYSSLRIFEDFVRAYGDDLYAAANDAGAALMSGLAYGIDSSIGLPLGSVSMASDVILGSLRDFWGWHSPATRMTGLGEDMMRGWGGGIAANDSPARALAAQSEALEPSSPPDLPQLEPSSPQAVPQLPAVGGTTVVNNIYITVETRADDAGRIDLGDLEQQIRDILARVA